MILIFGLSFAVVQLWGTFTWRIAWLARYCIIFQEVGNLMHYWLHICNNFFPYQKQFLVFSLFICRLQQLTKLNIISGTFQFRYCINNRNKKYLDEIILVPSKTELRGFQGIEISEFNIRLSWAFPFFLIWTCKPWERS